MNHKYHESSPVYESPDHHQRMYQSSTRVTSRDRVTTRDVHSSHHHPMASGSGHIMSDGTHAHILSERVVEHEVKIPKKVVKEEIIEKIIIVPEKVVSEEVIEDIQMVRERIVEIAKPVYVEKIVEVPQIEYIEKIIEVPEKVIQEKIIEVPRVEVQERVVQVPKVTYQERVVEVPEIEYREVPVERIVEVPEIREEIKVREVRVPTYLDKPVPEYVTVENPVAVERHLPVPVEAISTFEYKLPLIRPKYTKVQIPIYAPRFVEVPVPRELLDAEVAEQAAHLSKQVAILAQQPAPSLCEIEKMAEFAKNTQMSNKVNQVDFSEALTQAWDAGRVNVTQGF